MATGSLKKMGSIDAQLRLIAPAKVSEDDKLVEYDALLLDRFLDILQDLHGEEVREFVQECYEVAADYDGNRNTAKLEELGNMLTSLDPGDSIVVTKSFSNMLSLANLAEEVQIAYRRRIKKLKKGDFADEASATTESDIEETLKRLLQLNKTPEEVFDALKNQTVDLVLTAHPTQSVRRSLLQKFGRIRDCLTQLYAKDITPDDKQELDEALQREIQAAFRTDEIRRTPPTPQDEMRAGMSYFHETIWKGVPKFLRQLQPFGEQLRVNYQETRRLLLQVAGHKDILEGDPYLRQRLQLRDPYITTLNVCQAYTLKQIRDPSFHVKVRPHLSKDYMESSKPAAELVKLNPKSEYAPGLEDTVILTMKGIAAGMQNTG
ncbi:hypothetical protein BRARA_D02588 [Brassica rapa]|uniref:Phosphoenolpyruvate carboxylase n=1 Tax=Brassica campestris TaxID=3711 RepID=A0A397ZPT9_BRACM|nr:hypothetical protein BRARA_D02588 [Brassica rapa]